MVLPEIDQYGYDVILGDGDTMKPIQIKTTLKADLGQKWSRIHKNLLRPQIMLASANFNDISPATVGLGGGIVLIQPVIDSTNNQIEDVNYFYSDFCIWVLYREGIITQTAANTKPRNSLTDLAHAMLELLVGSGERMTVPFHLFVQARDAGSLMTLCDLNSGTSSASISHLIRDLLVGEDQRRAVIRKEFEEYCQELIL